MTRSLINPDHLMWGSDYPHSEGTFPYSRQKIAADFADIPADETRGLVRDNAKKLYRLSV
jgi:predicted TIM-barrel fold metal-dependent hydrolase